MKIKKISALVGTLSIVSIVLIGLAIQTEFLEQYSVHAQNIGTRSDKVRIYLADNYRSSGLIPITAQEEPSINVKYYQQDNQNRQREVIDELKVSLYKISKTDVLDFLTYSKNSEDGYYISKTLNTQNFEKVGSLYFANHSFEEKILLPIKGSGAWLARATVDGEKFNDAIILRSDIGGIAREGNDEYIIWSQHISSGKSLSTGTVEFFSLQDVQLLLDRKTLNSQGITTSDIRESADIALVESVKGELAVIPLNMPQNSYYRNLRFQEKQVGIKYYLFTDRPLYKPGDTVNFKAIVRKDDDAVYSTPPGTVNILTHYRYDDESPVYEKTIPLTTDGTVSGSFTLPEARTGYYRIEVSDPRATDRMYWLRTTAGFRVENFRKPEYTLDSEIRDLEYIKGDVINATLNGQYFFGEPLADVEANVSVGERYSYSNPKYLDSTEDIKNHLSYTYYYGNEVKQDKIKLDGTGEVQYQYDTTSFSTDSQANIAIFNFTYNDESGNSVGTKVNALVWSGEYSIVDNMKTRSVPVGSTANIAVSLMPHNDISITNVELSGIKTLTYWEKERANNKVGYEYKKRTQNLDSFSVRTNGNGEATTSFIPERSGSYEITFEGTDRRGNSIVYKTNIWAYNPSQFSYRSGGASGDTYNLAIEKDKEDYKPEDVANLTITSNATDRDVLITIERDRVRRYYVLPITGSSATFPLSLISTDVPNIYATVSGFSSNGYGESSVSLPVSAEGKELLVDITFDKEKYSPGETVQATITTRDNTGRPASSDVALWSVDKALYELSTYTRIPIFDFFWKKRYNGTTDAHSLEGIYTSGGAEKGCFVGSTEVLTPNGLRPIKDIKAGGFVLTRKGANKDQLVKAEVLKTFKHTVDGYLIINGHLQVTPEHKIWVNNEWRVAGDIQIGDTFVNSEGDTVSVDSIEWQKDKTEVFNLQTKYYHTYFAGGIWVHNDKGGVSRVDFADVAYWNPNIQTGADGKVTVSFTLPDNLTTWVSNAVAVTRDTRVGESKEEILVTKPVIVRPILPNYIRTGDNAELSALVYNYTDSSSDFVAMCRYQDEENESKFYLNQGEFEQVFFPEVSLQNEDIDAEIFCETNALNAEGNDSIINSLPVKQFGFNDTQTQVGNGNTTFDLSLHDDADKSLSKISLILTPSVFGTLPEAMKYLIAYPYGCTEQTTSRFVPAVIAKENQGLFSDILPDRNLDEIIDKGIERLVELKGSGGWSWWGNAGDNYGDAFTTAYVTEYLLRARDIGFNVPQWIFEDIKHWTERVALGNDSRYDNEQQIAIRYTLSLLDNTKYTSLIRATNSLSPDVLSLAVLTNVNNGHTDPNTNGANELIDKAQTRGSTLYWQPGRKEFYASQDASTALALRALTQAGLYDDAEKVTQYFALNRSSRFWSNTFATAQALEALTSYAKVSYPDSQSVNYEVILGDEKIADGSFSEPFEEITIDIDFGDIKNNTSLEIRTSGDNPLFSILNNEEFRTARNLPATSNGLTIHREYVGDFTPGETVEVILTITADQGYQDEAVIVQDYLPAGLVPVNTNLKNERQYSGLYGESRPSGVEVNEDGVVLAYRFWDGETLTAKYKARVVSRGEYTAPSAVASLMYQPEAYGRSQIQRVRISDNVRENGVIYSSDSDYDSLGILSKNGLIVLVILLLVIGVAVSVIWIRKRKNLPVNNQVSDENSQ